MVSEGAGPCDTLTSVVACRCKSHEIVALAPELPHAVVWPKYLFLMPKFLPSDSCGLQDKQMIFFHLPNKSVNYAKCYFKCNITVFPKKKKYSLASLSRAHSLFFKLAPESQ